MYDLILQKKFTESIIEDMMPPEGTIVILLHECTRCDLKTKTKNKNKMITAKLKTS
jgi:hypothetical protein